MQACPICDANLVGDLQAAASFEVHQEAIRGALHVGVRLVWFPMEMTASSDLEVALRVDAACMQDVEDAPEEWAQEKGAVEQEVASDLSDPLYTFLTRLNEDMCSGTPYAHDALGTRESFEATTGAMLKTFYRTWYAPNNAILVVAGDVDPANTLARVKALYGKIGRRPLSARSAVSLSAVTHESFTHDSNLPYALAFIAYRLPGTDSRDYAAARVLSDVLASQRGNIYALVPAGKALDAQFAFAETYPKASVGLASAALPAGTVRLQWGRVSRAPSWATQGTGCRPIWWNVASRARQHGGVGRPRGTVPGPRRQAARVELRVGGKSAGG